RAIASQLKKVGIRLNIESTDMEHLSQDAAIGNVQLFSLTRSEMGDPDALRLTFDGNAIPPNGENLGWYDNQELNKLLQEGLHTSDQERRREIYKRAEELIAEDVPA